MRRLLTSHSLLSQVVALGGVTILLTLLSSLMVTGAPAATSGAQAVRLVLAIMGIGLMSLALLTAATRRVLRPLHELRDALVDVIDGKVEPQSLEPPTIADLNRLNDAIVRVVAQLRQAQGDHESSKRTLAQRTKTVDRLLDFSQTIQGRETPSRSSPRSVSSCAANSVLPASSSTRTRPTSFRRSR